MNGMHWTNYAVGNPTPWSYYPNPMLTYTDRMDFAERATNFLFSLAWDVGNYFYYYPQQDALKEKVSTRIKSLKLVVFQKFRLQS
jgi:hypothetical protein